MLSLHGPTYQEGQMLTDVISTPTTPASALSATGRVG